LIVKPYYAITTTFVKFL